MMLLDAKCFFNKELAQSVERSTADASGVIGDLEVANLESIAWFLILVPFTALSLIMRLVQAFAYGSKGPPRTRRNDNGLKKQKFGRVLPIWCLIICGLTITVYIRMTLQIFKVRSWVSKSGWMEGNKYSKNPENDILALGQILALVAPLATMIIGMDNWRSKKVDE